MHSRQVFNQSVCNCHEDSELVSTLVCLFLKFLSKIFILILPWQLSMIDLVESIYSSLDKTSRTYYWQRLQGEIMKIFSKFGQQLFSILNLSKGEIYQFLDDFDQHMEEEESIFQPLLNQYVIFFSHSAKISCLTSMKYFIIIL